MAPVKSSGRTTRSTRAATVAKQNASATEKKSEASTTRKSVTAKSTKTAPATRRTRTKTDEPESEREDEEQPEVEESKPTTRGTKLTRADTKAAKAPTITVPRRKLRVTPLVASEPEPVPAPKDDSKQKAKQTRSGSSKTTTKVKPPTVKADTIEAEDMEAGDTAPVTKTRSTRTKASSRTTTKSDKAMEPAAKTRGRPKKAEPTIEANSEPKPTRTTRSGRAGSVASSVAPDTNIETQTLTRKPTAAAAKKKVTFQDLLEDDKENQPVSTKAKKATTTKQAATTGLKAKPVRKPTVSTSSTRKTASTKEDSTKQSDTSKKMPTVLTPKKVTQVARAATPESQHSDGEDELNGGKTPLRDLSMSPRRPQTSAAVNALAQSMSPRKKLEFGPTFHSTSTVDIPQNGGLLSPARRLPASPTKDVSANQSPKRRLGDVGRLLFSASKSANNDATVTNQTAADSTMLMQSPKRSAVLNTDKLFSESVIKSARKSPFKASLLGSPAKRPVLFSPIKKSTSSIHRPHNEEQDDELLNDIDVSALMQEEDIAVSSHQRPVSSPLRVHRMTEDELQLDFDESVLQVRSPLKIFKSPTKATTPKPSESEQAVDEATTDDHETTFPASLEQGTFIEPKALETQTESVGSDREEDDSFDDSQEMEAAPQEVADHVKLTKSPIVAKYRDLHSSSEDELADEDTPYRASGHQALSRKTVGVLTSKIRESVGLSSSINGAGFGFTPLAEQVSGWKASSPNKQTTPNRRESAEFSPLARQHIDGEVTVSRDNTPVQKLDLSGKRSLGRNSTPLASKSGLRKSVGLRKSIVQRESLALPSPSRLNESPAKSRLFEEEMATREEEQVLDEHHESMADQETVDEADHKDFEQIMDVAEQDSVNLSDEEGDTILVHETTNEDVEEPIVPAELTTDLVNFTHASDTAIVDFQKLAAEADHLASEASHMDDETDEQVEVMIAQVAENEHQMEQAEPEDETLLAPDVSRIPFESSPVAVATPASLQEHELTQMAGAFELEQPDFTVDHVDTATPVAQGLISRKFNVNTVVSKVPLRPEGEMSPIKIPKKRALSFGAAGPSSRSSKRVSFGRLPDIPSQEILNIDNAAKDEDDEIAEAERRTHRSSVAPSPGGTSTPATTKTARSIRTSLGVASTMSTPGRLSFGVSDFGDSTLDGIELPSDFDEPQAEDQTLHEPTVELGTGELTRIGISISEETRTPQAKSRAEMTPATHKSNQVVSTFATPATITKTLGKSKTPLTTSRKTPSLSTQTHGRTPLKAVADGPLATVTVFVDVRTSEGADASGIFIELLTSLGAKCVREWRWNGRASLAADSSEAVSSGPGITHVVFKDGSPKTLERVRQAHAAGLSLPCVGVAWVLDCEKENKWIDETTYLIDKDTMAKVQGTGSRRRKSMEPSMLVADGLGSVKKSASKGRRSVSTELMRGRSSLETPTAVRSVSAGSLLGLKSYQQQDEDKYANEDFLDEEDTENLAPTRSPTDSPEFPAGTPTGYVAYDPRTAMTPGPQTPYLVSQGKKLVQMSAPPKNLNKSLFDQDDEDDDQENIDREVGENNNSKKRKFRLSKGNVKDAKKRRQTLGFQPVVGSPLARI